MDQSIAHYLEAIKIDPAFADAFSNLGNAYKETGHLDDAMVCYNKALTLEPKYAEAYSNLAATNKDCGKIVEAILLYQKALEIKPDFGDVIANLFHSLVLDLQNFYTNKLTYLLKYRQWSAIGRSERKTLQICIHYLQNSWPKRDVSPVCNPGMRPHTRCRFQSFSRSARDMRRESN